SATPPPRPGPAPPPPPSSIASSLTSFGLDRPACRAPRMKKPRPCAGSHGGAFMTGATGLSQAGRHQTGILDELMHRVNRRADISFAVVAPGLACRRPSTGARTAGLDVEWPRRRRRG